ncbi:MAG: hypothetical protein ABSG49_09775 [Methanoregula sp.]|jgi:hypothetical protein|uniref:hypothetical protein n=1 Tax=Methanoregula sp. TaxID=2052170 RepID=UPI003C28F8EB
MNTGIIMIGLALILFSVALMVSPSAAASPDTACSLGCGSTIFLPNHSVEQGCQSAGGDCGISCIPEKIVTGSVSLP